MPTENRSSNTEMGSVPRNLAEEINSALYDHDLNGLTVRLQELLDRPEQHQGDPVLLPMRRSWSGIAGWRDQAEIKAWNACLDEIAKLGPLYTHAHVCEKCRGVHCSKTVCVLEIAGERDSLRAQLAERDALLRGLQPGLYEAASMAQEIRDARPFASSTSIGAPYREFSLKDARSKAEVLAVRLSSMADALSASAEREKGHE